MLTLELPFRRLVEKKKKKSSAMCIIYFSDIILMKVAGYHEYEFHVKLHNVQMLPDTKIDFV